MNSYRNRFILMMLIGTIVLFSQGCYYDVAEDLYPPSIGGGNCDTSNITYATKIAPIMQQYCTSCHSGSSPSGNIDLSTFAGVNMKARDGSLYGSVNHMPGYSAMPQNGNKLDDCSIKVIKIWADSGALNN